MTVESKLGVAIECGMTVIARPWWASRCAPPYWPAPNRITRYRRFSVGKRGYRLTERSPAGLALVGESPVFMTFKVIEPRTSLTRSEGACRTLLSRKECAHQSDVSRDEAGQTLAGTEQGRE